MANMTLTARSIVFTKLPWYPCSVLTLPGPPALPSDSSCPRVATMACPGLVCPAGGLTRGFVPR